MKTYIHKTIVPTTSALLVSAFAFAAPIGHNPPVLERSKTVSCKSNGWEIQVKDYDQNLADSVTFVGKSVTTRTLRERPAGWQPFHNNETIEYFDPIVSDASKPNLGKVCANDGSVIGFGQSYVVISKQNHYPWKYTQVERMGAVNSTDFNLNAVDLFRKHDFTLKRNANGQPLPQEGALGGLVCAGVTLVCDFSASRPDAPTLNTANMRVSIMDLADSGMSGGDIYHYLRGDDWGSHKEDLNGFSESWRDVLINLGYVDLDAIRDRVAERTIEPDGSRFIFKKLEPQYHPLDLLIVEEDEDDLQLIITPRNINQRTNGKSWPTSNHVEQSQPRIFQAGRPNPNYCPENAPGDPEYIPQYLADPNVLVELSADMKYLTSPQIERIEDLGWQITDGMRHWSDDDWAQSAQENPNRRRLEYNCIMVEPANGTSTGAFDESRDNVANCRTKDIAYYDALIERMIVVNPVIGTVANHPCNKLRKLEAVARPEDLATMQVGTVAPKSPSTESTTRVQDVKRPLELKREPALKQPMRTAPKK